jgi:hypothetical protein
MGTHPSRAHAQAAYNAGFAIAAIGAALSFAMASRLPRGVPATKSDSETVIAEPIAVAAVMTD